MERYRYLLPIVSICAPPGARLHQSIPLARIARLVDGRHATLRVERVTCAGGKVLDTRVDELRFDDGTWSPVECAFDQPCIDEDGWMSGRNVAYLETHLSIAEGASLTSQFGPGFYTVYSGPGRKTFFSDNALKYGNTVNIYQIKAFDTWIEGYPTCTLDRARDYGESIVLINPFLKQATARIELEGVEATRSVRVPAQTGLRVDVAQLFGIGDEGWSGQWFVWGRSRLVVYDLKHSWIDPASVTTLEHTNPYRGEITHEPLSQRLRRDIGERLLGIGAGREP